MGLELTFIKYLVDTLFINKFLILGLKGLLGTIVFNIINTTVTKQDFYNFFDSLLAFQYSLEPEEFSLVFQIFYILTTCIVQYLKIIVVTKFNEIYFISTLMITEIIYFPLYCIERFVVQKFQISTFDTFIINAFISIINTILMLIFNEILELNFCGLNKNIRKNIIIREKKEILNLFHDDEYENLD